MNAKLVRDVRLLKAYAIASTVCFFILLLTAAQSERKQRFGEIDAERINIVEPDGRVDMVITDKAHFPPPSWKGKPMDVGRQGETGQGLPGIVFYNAEGTDDGGLAFSGGTREGKYQAGAGLIFDQYDQDQIVGIAYDDDNGERTAGLHVWERPNTPLIDLIRKQQSIEGMPEGPAKEAALKQLQEQATRGDFGGQSRVFVGKNEKNTSEVTLADAERKPRVRMTVESAGRPTLEFLDKDGKIVYSLPPGGGK
jgi:hypothetical protein